MYLGTSRNEEKERKGRCRLDFSASSEKKPLEGMKIFLDIPSQKIAQMTAQVIQLGGVSVLSMIHKSMGFFELFQQGDQGSGCLNCAVDLLAILTHT